MLFDVPLDYRIICANQVKIPPSAQSLATLAWYESATDKYMLNGDQHDVMFYKIQSTSSMPNPVKDKKDKNLHGQLTIRLLHEQFGPVCNIFKHIIFIFIP